jgi:molybdate transport system ATP-binding protein
LGSGVDVGFPDSPRLDVQMHHRIGALVVDVAFSLTQPWTVLFGPSGSGKSTILRAIAGLVHPDSGKMVWQRSSSSDSFANSYCTLFDSSVKRCRPPHTRSIALGPQAASLFPHMTAAENVAYKFHQQTEAQREDVEAVLALFRITHLAEKLPAALSGGEAQRVNLARAVVAAQRDSVLLLDEPFTGLDFALRSKLIAGLQTWAKQRNLCVLSVTHDVEEAFQLGADVIKIADGKLVAQGPVEIVLAEERTQLLAQLTVGRQSPA